MDEIQSIIDQVKQLQLTKQGLAVTWIVGWVLLSILRYVITGIVVWAVGRRLIHAWVYIWRESHHDAS